MSATFSACRTFRYTLTRTWPAGCGTVNFVGLNPSTADELTDDPTIRRCMGYAKTWGFDSLRMLNLFAFRATDPKDMMAAADPVGPENDEHFRVHLSKYGTNIAAWGAGGWYRGRGPFILDIFGDRLKVLRLTKCGHPAHPLYLPKTLTPIEWD